MVILPFTPWQLQAILHLIPPPKINGEYFLLRDYYRKCLRSYYSCIHQRDPHVTTDRDLYDGCTEPVMLEQLPHTKAYMTKWTSSTLGPKLQV